MGFLYGWNVIVGGFVLDVDLFYGVGVVRVLGLWGVVYYFEVEVVIIGGVGFKEDVWEGLC